jgi:2-alkenal reductase
MNRKSLAILLLFITTLTATFGAFSGGIIVYRLESMGLINLRTTASLQDDPMEIQATPEVTENERPDTTSSNSIFVSNSDVETSVTKVVQQVAPAVVTVVGTVSFQSEPFGLPSSSEVSGSGVFISNEGYLLTNYHVVEDANNLYIILSDGSESDVSLIGYDMYADLAVLKSEGNVPAVAILGNSEALDPGETVIAIGSPLGDFKNSVTTGVVSATGRSIDTGEGYKIEDLIQTDAAINQGNSGGPLVNLAGEVIGLNTLIVRSSRSGTAAEGLGFAVSANSIVAIASQIIETGRFSRPFIGIRFQTITPNIANRYRLPVEYGAYITEVVENSPADLAGLRSDDIIVEINDILLDETHSYLNTIFKFEPGEMVTVQFVRNGDLQAAEVMLGET